MTPSFSCEFDFFFDVGVTVSARARNLHLPNVTAEDCPSVNPDTASRMRDRAQEAKAVLGRQGRSASC